MKLLLSIRPEISGGRKEVPAKKTGSGHTLFISFVFIATMVLLFRFHYQKTLIRSIYEYVDEGLTVSLMASGVINREEYGRSRQVIIHNNLPDSLFEVADENEELPEGVILNKLPEPVTINVINAPDILLADEAVKHSYRIFEDALKTNLNLSSSFHSKIPIIITNIEVKKYIVFNVFRNVDTDFNYTGDSRICRYEYRQGSWYSSIAGSAGTVGIATSSLVNKGYLTIQNTSVFAEIAFDVQIMPYSRLYFPDDMNQEEQNVRVSYSRAVDITVE